MYADTGDGTLVFSRKTIDSSKMALETEIDKGET